MKPCSQSQAGGGQTAQGLYSMEEAGQYGQSFVSGPVENQVLDHLPCCSSIQCLSLGISEQLCRSKLVL